MSKYYYSHKEHCHWCGTSFDCKQPNRRHVFCKSACKMAHYRAYKKYVTQKRYQKPGSQAKSVTRKKRKKITGYRCLGCNHHDTEKAFETNNPQHPLKCPACGRRPGFQVITDITHKVTRKKHKVKTKSQPDPKDRPHPKVWR